jgi:hypothetical protein
VIEGITTLLTVATGIRRVEGVRGSEDSNGNRNRNRDAISSAELRLGFGRIPTAPRQTDTSPPGANLADFVQNTGTADGVSCSAAPHQLPTRSPSPSPAGDLAYITIPMIGSKVQSDGSGTYGSGSPRGTGSASTGVQGVIQGVRSDKRFQVRG